MPLLFMPLGLHIAQQIALATFGIFLFLPRVASGPPPTTEAQEDHADVAFKFATG